MRAFELMQMVGFGGVESGIIVSGAGTASVNGNYTENGTEDGKPVYFLNGGGINDKIAWSSTFLQWSILNGPLQMYLSVDNVATPDLATTWEIDEGSLPVPTVAAG